MSADHETITIRPLRADDADALRGLAERDSAAVPAGPMLGAEQGGSLVAAISAASSEVVADPFRHTAAAVEMLTTRARQLDGHRRPRLHLRGRISAARAVPSSAPLS